MAHPPQDQPSPWLGGPLFPNQDFTHFQDKTFKYSQAPEAKRKDPAEGWFVCHWAEEGGFFQISLDQIIEQHRADAITTRQHHHIYIFRGPKGQRRAVIWHRPADQPGLTIEDETC